MDLNLASDQKDLIRWLVQQVDDGKLAREFTVTWTAAGPPLIAGLEGDTSRITKGRLEALADAQMISCVAEYAAGSMVSVDWRCTLRQKAYDALVSEFGAPDTSFVIHLTPLADITSLDGEIKTRCLPILGAGSADSKLWDSAVRTVGVILEERLREVGGIADSSPGGLILVNNVFGKKGKLASKFDDDSKRQGYRDLYAGLFGTVRNRYAHRLTDPTPVDGGAIIVFVNLLLKMLEELR